MNRNCLVWTNFGQLKKKTGNALNGQKKSVPLLDGRLTGKRSFKEHFVPKQSSDSLNYFIRQHRNGLKLYTFQGPTTHGPLLKAKL